MAAGDVVIARSNIGNERSEYIERRAHAQIVLLNLHIGSDLIHAERVRGPLP